MDDEGSSVSEKCLICALELGSGDVVIVKTEKGVSTVNASAKKRGLAWKAKAGQRFHKICRQNHIKKDRCLPAASTNDPTSVVTRLSSPPPVSKARPKTFDYRTCCLFCTEQVCARKGATVEILSPLSRTKEGVDSIPFVDSEVKFDKSIKEELKGRLDDWACEVRGRVESVSSLRSEETVYHRDCMQRFYLKRKRAGSKDEVGDKRKGLNPQQAAFLKVIEYFEENESLHLTVVDLQTYEYSD